MVDTTKPQVTEDACLYCRVSKADKRQKRSVPQQEAEGRAVARHNDWHLPDSAVFVETKAISASRFTNAPRPKYDETIAYLKTNRPKVLILWEVSRYNRKLGGGVTLLDLCRDLGIKIHVVSLHRTFDPSVQHEREALVHEFLAAERESEQISLRTKRDAFHSAEAGKPNGLTPYGYVREYSSTRELLRQVPKPEQSEVVTEAYERFRMSENLSSIVKEFNSRQIPSPNGKAWTIVKLRKILTNPAYMGKRSHRGTLYKAVWPAIVTEEVWQDCNDKLTNPARRTNHQGTKARHLLTSLMPCSVCGGQSKAAINNGYRVYMCRDKHCASVPIEEANAYVEAQIRARLITVSLNPDSENSADREKALGQAATIQTRLDEIEEALADPNASAVAILTKTYDRLTKERDELLSQATNVRKSPIVGYLSSNPEKWDDLTLSQKREFIASGTLVDYIELVPHGKSFTRKPIEERVEIHWTETRLSADPHA
ncbi:recombinase family protein [Micromonospora sp. CPCC 205711]|uniref:recombinase family protein n=1 Tax=Micromonospora sp. CPCC 205547 TaxID=3122400 RepID=UPI002FF08CAC